MKMKTCLFLALIVALLVSSCGAIVPAATATAVPPTETETMVPPTSTPTPLPTPTPTATPKPTAEDLLISIGLARNPDMDASCVTPCKGYQAIQFENGGLIVLSAAIFDDGQFRIAIVTTAATPGDNPEKMFLVIRQLYGDKIASWMESHYDASTGNVRGGNEVVDGHWVAIGVGQTGDVKQMLLIVSPDESVPSGVNL